jgi:hypothetical protein
VVVIVSLPLTVEKDQAAGLEPVIEVTILRQYTDATVLAALP